MSLNVRPKGGLSAAMKGLHYQQGAIPHQLASIYHDEPLPEPVFRSVDSEDPPGRLPTPEECLAAREHGNKCPGPIKHKKRRT